MKTIIIMRCAPNSHHEFAGLAGEGITFLPSFYGEKAPDKPEGADYFHYFKGGKWSGIYDLFKTYPELLDAFDYYWFVDDDILAKPETARRFFRIVEENRFELAQPALTTDSYWAHRITIQNKGFLYRNSNLVELMMPIMQQDFLKRVLPLFKNRDAAMGLDFMWHQLTSNPARDVAIIDATPMRHSRPRQKLLSSEMKKYDKDIYAERDRTVAELSIKRQMPVVMAAKTLNGRQFGRSPALLAALFWELAKSYRAMSVQKLRFKDFFNIIIQQSFGDTHSQTHDSEALKEICKACAIQKSDQ